MKCHLLCALLVAGCGGGSAVNVTKMIGSGGGTVSHSDGTSVTLPMGALTANANITIASVNATAPAGTVLVGPAYDFGPEGTVFARPVTITLPYETSKLPEGRTAADIVIYTAPRGTTQYTALPTTLGSGTVTTATSHFTVYLPAAPLTTVGPPDMSSSHPTDMAVAPPDMAITAVDMLPANCVPQCTTGTTSCGCTERCNGSVYTMSCSQSSSLANCFCEINGQTQSTQISGVTCDALSSVQGGFSSSCVPN